MKPEELDQSNLKRIIIGTYKMCAEGYDNPRLNTIILGTSKRDIVQIVGRILGLRCSGNIQPKIVDIVDTYSTFAGQGYARKKYYKQQNFEPAKPDFTYE
jgi:superfamily II DNA or RNA helicase